VEIWNEPHYQRALICLEPSAPCYDFVINTRLLMSLRVGVYDFLAAASVYIVLIVCACV
jgi:hypothetical protein